MLPPRSPLAIALGAALVLSATQAHAQQAGPAAMPAAAATDDTGQPQQLDSVVITATRGSKAIDKIPGAISVVTREELDDQLLVTEDLSQVLATQVPGYAPTRQKLTSFGESMRGRAPLILFDGVPQTNPLRNGAREGYFADPQVIERIEVVSGASAVQGLGATGGIINYISRTPRTEGTQHTFDAKFGTQGRSDDALWKAGYRLEHKHRAFDALLYVGATLRGVGVDGDGRRVGLEATQGDTQDSTATDYFIKLGYDFAGTQRLQLSANQYRIEGDGDWRRVDGIRALGVTTSAERGTPVGKPPRNHVRTVSVEWSDADLAGGFASVQLYKQDFSALYGADTSATFQDVTLAPLDTLVDQSEIVADKAGLRTSWVRPDFLVTGLELTAGLDWLHDKSRQQLARTGRTWVPELDFTSTAPFAQLEYEAGDFTVRGGARREHAKLSVDTYRTLAVYGSREVAGGERSFTQWVKNIGGVWRFAEGWSMFAAYNEGFGLPDVGLVLRAVNKPDQSVENLVALEPVITENREAGLTWSGTQGSFTASAYDSRSELGTQVVVTNGIGRPTRVPVRVKGVEFAGEWRPHEAWTFNATYATTRGKTAAEQGAPLDVYLGARSQGPDKLVGAVAWQVSPALRLRLQGEHYRSRDVNQGRRLGGPTGPLIEEHFDGYAIADFGATWATRFGEFGLGIENLFDRQYVGYYAQANYSGTERDYFAGRGRTYTLSWRRTFD